MKAKTINVPSLNELKNMPFVFIPKKPVMKFSGKNRAEMSVKR